MKPNDKALYSTMSKYYDQIVHLRNHYLLQVDLVNSICRHLEIKKNEKILDAACGTGQVGLMLTDSGFSEFYFNDISSDMLLELSKHDIDNERVSNFSWQELDKLFNTDGKYKLIYILGHSLPHAPFDDLELIFKNIYAGLNENSYFLFDIRNWKMNKKNELIENKRDKDSYRNLGEIEYRNKKITIYDKPSYSNRVQHVHYKLLESISNKQIDEFSLYYSVFTLDDVFEILKQVGFIHISIISNKLSDWPYQVICCKK